MDLFRFQEAATDLAPIIEDRSVLKGLFRASGQKIMINNNHSKCIIFFFDSDDRSYACKVMLASDDLKLQKMELEMASFLTRKFCETGMVPGICPTYYVGQGDRLAEIIPVPKQCPTMEDYYLGYHTLHASQVPLCHFLGYPTATSWSPATGMRLEQLDSSYHLMIMDTGHPFQTFLDNVADQMTFADPKDCAQIVLRMDRAIFLLIFTFAVIQERYPGFVHDDAGSRNILVKMLNPSDQTACASYHFKGKEWQLPIRGEYPMLIDFELSAILEESTDQRPFTPYDDVWQMLHMLYFECRIYLRDAVCPPPIMELILARFERLLDMNYVNRIDKYAPGPINISLAHFPKIAATAKTPQEYLMEGYFDQFLAQDDPEVVIHTRYNDPDRSPE